jgi:nucleoid DNA-binding protein
MPRNKQELIYLLANKYDLPINKVEEIVEYQFKFVKEIMKDGTFDAVRLPYFGKFSAKKERIKHMNRITDESKR